MIAGIACNLKRLFDVRFLDRVHFLNLIVFHHVPERLLVYVFAPMIDQVRSRRRSKRIRKKRMRRMRETIHRIQIIDLSMVLLFLL